VARINGARIFIGAISFGVDTPSLSHYANFIRALIIVAAGEVGKDATIIWLAEV